MQRANPTSTRPSRRPGSSGRKAQASASYKISTLSHQELCFAARTMRKGATIQFTRMLKPTCIQSCLDRKALCSVSYSTLHKIGYIITSRPIAVKRVVHVSSAPRTSSRFTYQSEWILQQICPSPTQGRCWARSYPVGRR